MSDIFRTVTWTSREPLHKSEPRSVDLPNLHKDGIYVDQKTSIFLSIKILNVSHLLSNSDDADRPLDIV